MSQTLFVTGTDTGVGKTRVACALIAAARDAGLRVAGFKPVASGAERTPAGLRNDDALQLLVAAGGELNYEDVNPCCYEAPIAPHLAARDSGRSIDVGLIDRTHARLEAAHDLIIVEGAGGWRVPLDEGRTFADWVETRGWPVLLVVGIRLGCISHALLSAESIARRTTLLGWIANQLPPMAERAEDQIEDLRNRLPTPLWGQLPTDGNRIAEASASMRDWLDHCGRCAAGLANSGRAA